jgi:hypothetical protein
MSQLAEHFERRSLDSVVPEDQENTKCQEGSAVCDIAEHDAKEEGEGDSGQDGRVELLVARHTVSVGDFLGHECVAVGVEGGGRSSKLNLMQRGRGHHLAQAFPEELNLILGHIQLAVNNLFPELELIERFINNPFLPQENPPALKIPNVLDLVQKGDHFLFIHANKIDNFIVLFSEPLQSLPGVIFHFVEEEEVVAEGFDYALDLFL